MWKNKFFLKLLVMDFKYDDKFMDMLINCFSE